MCQQGSTCTGIKLKTIVSRMVNENNVHNAAGVEGESRPMFTRCTSGVLWRISHVHEVSYILGGTKRRERGASYFRNESEKKLE